MSIKQISVFVENKTGTLAKVTRFIAEAHINLKAFCVADSQEFGIMRIICECPDEANELLKQAGFVTKITHVLAVEINDRPGGMATILEVLSDAGVSVEYIYAFSSYKTDVAYMMFRVDDRHKAMDALDAAGIHVADQDEIFGA